MYTKATQTVNDNLSSEHNEETTEKKNSDDFEIEDSQIDKLRLNTKSHHSNEKIMGVSEGIFVF